MNDDAGKTVGEWSAEEASVILDAIGRYGGATAALVQDVCERTGRSEKSVMRKLVKIGHLQWKGGGIVGFRRAYGHVS